MRLASGLGAVVAVVLLSACEPTSPPDDPSVRPESIEQAPAQHPVAAEPGPPPGAAEPAPPPATAAAPAPAPQQVAGEPAGTSQPLAAPAAVATAPAAAATRPPSSPATGTTATAASGSKPCPTGQCFWNGKCVKPGGPIARPGAPPDEISGLCGGDGGPCHPCRCASADTPIDTPSGPVPIQAIQAGDKVYSIDHGEIVAVPVIAVQAVAVHDHAMVRVRLTGGALLELSGYHPLGDGRALFDLVPGERLGQASVEALALVPYDQPFTYDILPDSDTRTYFARGVWLGSTMAPAGR